MLGTLVGGVVGIQHYDETLILTFDRSVGTLTFKILFKLYLRKVQEVDTWKGHWLGGVGVQSLGDTFL